MLTSNEIIENAKIIMDIIACAMRNETYQEACDYEVIYRIANYHHVEGIVYLGLKDISNIWVEKLKTTYEQIQMKVLYFESERAIILEKMKEQGLSYLPLKGINLLACYPDCGMRFMSDNDILYGYINESEEGYVYDETKEILALEKMNEIMKALGYKIYHNHSKDDVYTKNPFYVFEMHRRLVAKSSEYYKYFKYPWKDAIRSTSDPNLYHFNLNEEYIYLIYHAYKHFEYSGFGIRYLIDIHYFLEKYEHELDKNHIKQRLNEIGCLTFEQNSLKLTRNAFKETMDNEDLKMLYYLLGCGTYGNVGANVHNQLKKKSKKQYLIDRLFPHDAAYEEMYPTFYKYKILLIFLPFYRLFKALIKSPKRIFVEIKSYIKSK